MKKKLMIKNKTIASPYLRLVAYLIDLSISSMPILSAVTIISGSTDITLILSQTMLLGLFLIYPTFYALITALMISTLGGTFGKLLTGTRIINSEGKNLSFWKSIWRNLFGYTVSKLILWIGFIWIIVDEDKRGWHDMMADSYVVLKNKWIFIIGIIVLAFLIFIQFSLITISINNFKSNTSVYTEIYNEINTIVT